MQSRAHRVTALLGVAAMFFLSVSWPGRAAIAGAPAHQVARSTATTARCRHNIVARGTIRFSDWQFPSTMNGYQSTQAVRGLVANAIFDRLYGVDDKGRFVPFMMSKYPTRKNGLISQDGKTVTVIIKPGLRWFNGKPLTAADEKFGWQVDMNKITGPACLGTCDVIKVFDVINRTTVRLRLKHPAPTDQVLDYNVWPSFGWQSADANGGYPKGDVKAAATWLEDPKTNFESSSYPTSGPYKIDDFTAGNTIVMSPNPYYADFTCGAYIKQLIFQGYTSKVGMEAAAAGHDTDMTEDYTSADLPALQQHSGAYKIWNQPAFLVNHIELNVLNRLLPHHPNALTDVRVRQALNLALDKLGLIQAALNLPGRKAARALAAWTPWIVGPGYSMQFADRSITGAWDPLARAGKGAFVTPGTPAATADARALLAQAGHPGGAGVTIDFSTPPPNTLLSQEISLAQQSWNQIGVTTNMLPCSGWHSGSIDPCSFLDSASYSAAVMTWLVGPDPDTSMKYYFQSKYIGRPITWQDTSLLQNFSGVRDKLIDHDFDQAALSPDPAVRRRLYTAIQERIAKQVYWIPLYYRPALATSDGAFTGFKPSPIPDNDTWNIYDWKPVGG